MRKQALQKFKPEQLFLCRKILAKEIMRTFIELPFQVKCCLTLHSSKDLL